MSDSVIIDFSAYLKKKQDKERLKEIINTSGWEMGISDFVQSGDSDICIYLIDTREKGILLFGCHKSDFLPPGSDDIIHWGHFVLAWDVIADPEMPFDEAHKKNTMEFAVRALSGLDDWTEFSVKAFGTGPGKKAHIMVLVDRKNMEQPEELIVAHSESPVLNVESVQTIIGNYLNDLSD